jgi:S-DNA-T family DNA segregation ATPase FtsK/SpoIIIE
MTEMSTDQIPSRSWGPAGDHEDHGDRLPAVIPGEVLHETVETGPGDHFDDIPPGVIEYVDYPAPRLTRAGSAAIVAARAIGGGIGATASGGWTLARWFGHGTRSAGYLGWRYVRAHDHQEVIGGMKNSAEWNRVHQTRRKRWKLLACTGGGLGLADLFSWGAIVGWGHVPAGSWESWAAAPSGEGLIAVVLLTLYGRYRQQNRLAPEQVVSPEDVDDEEEPFPLAWCRTGEQVEECVSRALAYEGIATRRIQLLARKDWGYEIDITLKGSTPGKVNAAADQLEAHMNLRFGGCLIEPDPSNRAHLTLRLVTSNPFADMPKPLVHAPNSLDVADSHNFGRCMDGSPLDLVLEGTRILVIGVSGAAKSTGVLRDLAEVVTACHNGIALDLDPIKDGLREFEGTMAAPPIRGNAECEQWLAWLVRMAEARNKVRNRLKMGDTWRATADHPAIFVFVDEFIYMSAKAKEDFIKLVRLGKQSGMFPIAAGQDATSGSLGDAIADTFTLRIMLASRHDDIPITFGQGAIAQGYRPDRLVPAQNKGIKNDAGQSYIKGAGITRPLLFGWNEYARADIERAVEARAAAGRPWFDNDTLAEAGLLAELQPFRPASAPAASMADLLERQGTDEARAFAVLMRAFEKAKAEWLPTADLLATGAVSEPGALQRLIARRAPMAKSSKGTVGGRDARGWDRKTVEDAANALFAPS